MEVSKRPNIAPNLFLQSLSLLRKKIKNGINKAINEKFVTLPIRRKLLYTNRIMTVEKECTCLIRFADGYNDPYEKMQDIKNDRRVRKFLLENLKPALSALAPIVSLGSIGELNKAMQTHMYFEKWKQGTLKTKDPRKQETFDKLIQMHGTKVYTRCWIDFPRSAREWLTQEGILTQMLRFKEEFTDRDVIVFDDSLGSTASFALFLQAALAVGMDLTRIHCFALIQECQNKNKAKKPLTLK